MSEYLTNLQAFKGLIERYTIADLKSMIYKLGDKPSGGCCYPAAQTLFSLMEMLGRLLDHRVSGEDAFVRVLTRLGSRYNEDLGRRLYGYFRNGIAHTSLAKSGVAVKKSGDRDFHLSNNGNNIDIRILFEDFLPCFENLFSCVLRDERLASQYEDNLNKVFRELNLEKTRHVAEGDLDISADYSRTSISGTRLPQTPSSGASETDLSTGESKLRFRLWKNPIRTTKNNSF